VEDRVAVAAERAGPACQVSQRRWKVGLGGAKPKAGLDPAEPRLCHTVRALAAEVEKPPRSQQAAEPICSGAISVRIKDTGAVLQADQSWMFDIGDSPVVATAIHAGSVVRGECLPYMRLPPAERLREEDPFTDALIQDFPSRIVVHRSRFEIDLNRDLANAIYRTPEQAWGLEVWKESTSDAVLEPALAFHQDYYAVLKQALAAVQRRFGRFVVIDVHSYNHRRGGPEAAPTPQGEAPDINIGTFSMDRQRWGSVVDGFIETLRNQRFRGKPVDVRENISFQGKGEQTRFIHDHFPESGCAIAVEFKKIFMDEWTGEPQWETIASLRRILASTIPVLERLLDETK
jgi:hypothetical protein